MKFILLLSLAILSTAVRAADDMILLGMVEDVPGVQYGEGHSTKVRVLFSHKGNEWRAYKSTCDNYECLTNITSSFPNEVTWYVGMDGHQVGKVTARSPKSFKYYAHIGHQDIFAGTAPAIGKATSEFAGFAGGEIRRPLVAASKPNFQDPQKWKRYQPTSALVKQAIQILHKSAPAVCREGKSETTPLIPYNLGNGDIEIRAHKSVDGSLLMTVFVKDGIYCDGGDGDGLYDSQMFAIDATGNARYLGPGLMLVDAGDYDGNGTSELVMSISRHNRGGYVLFSSAFVEVARFEFGYH